MKKISIAALIITLVMTWGCGPAGFQYPETRKGDQVDDYFGTMVPDPYRWLEDDNSDETAAWVKGQNELTFDYLESISFRDEIHERLTQMWNYEKMSTPWKEGGYYFFTKNDGLQNQNVYYMMKDLESEPELVLDPNLLSEDGTVALNVFEISKDGRYLGYGISRGGSDWREFYVRDLETGQDLDDHIMWAKFSSLSWYKNGFFYSRYPEPGEGEALKGENRFNKVYYHKVGTPQSEDILIYEDPAHPDWSYSVGVSEDEEYMFLIIMQSTSGNALYIKKSDIHSPDWIKLVEGFEQDYLPVDYHDGIFYVLTNDEAPKYKLIEIPVNKSNREYWTDLIPEKEDRVLNWVSLGGQRVFAGYNKDAQGLVEIYDLQGNYQYELELPAIGSVGGFNMEWDDEVTFYTFTSFTYPSMIFKYHIETDASEEYWKPQIDFDGQRYATRQVFYRSKDGTPIPMFIVHKKGLEMDGSNSTLLYGYGGFNISLTPSFSISRIKWLEDGGIYAMANLRGGGEYGEKWHLAGTKLQKQNVFDDFIAAAEFLINENYTSPEKLVIQGASNGGLLVGAVVNQAPELFAVAIPEVGVMDMLRYHKFTIGYYWAVDYGTSEDGQEMFEYLYAYSPLHNIRDDVAYPAVLVTTADHDDRVVPAHSFKYMATLQDKNIGLKPTMIRIETKAGHGGGMPTSKIIEEVTDIYAFIYQNLGMSPVK